jgi:hypothetical protein
LRVVSKGPTGQQGCVKNHHGVFRACPLVLSCSVPFRPCRCGRGWRPCRRTGRAGAGTRSRGGRNDRNGRGHGPADGQQPGQPGVDANGDGIDDATGEILVNAYPIKGVVKADQPPIVTLDEEEIASYGVSSIQDLLSVLAPQTGSGRGRSSDGPVILLNGMRISNFREMRGLPPEAIRRVEVLPEEVALKYGYRPDQRVVNFILKDHYKSLSTETEASAPGNGSYAALSEEATLAKIANKARVNITGTVSTQGAVTEAERGISQHHWHGQQRCQRPQAGRLSHASGQDRQRGAQCHLVQADRPGHRPDAECPGAARLQPQLERPQHRDVDRH